MPPRAVTCLLSAAALWCPELAIPEATQLSWRGGGSEDGPERHQLRLRELDITRVGGIRVTTPLRTLADVARMSPFLDAVSAGDQLLRRRVNPHEVAELRSRAALRGHQRMLDVLDCLDPRSANPFESHTRLLLNAAGVGPIISQWAFLGHFYDFWLPAIHTAVEADGYEFHRSRSDYRRDRWVQQNAVGRGINLLRLSWEDVMLDPVGVIRLLHSVALAHRKTDAMGAQHPALTDDMPGVLYPLASAGVTSRCAGSPVRQPSLLDHHCAL